MTVKSQEARILKREEICKSEFLVESEFWKRQLRDRETKQSFCQPRGVRRTKNQSSRTSKGRGFGLETRSEGQLEAGLYSKRSLVSNNLNYKFLLRRSVIRRAPTCLQLCKYSLGEQRIIPGFTLFL